MDGQAPEISRIVTCYYQWNYLAQWLYDDELFHANVEWIVVNDAPEDRPEARLREELDRRHVRLVAPHANIGRSRARNLGARVSTGRWLDFVDGDDRPLPIMVEDLCAANAGLLVFPIRTAMVGDMPFCDAARAPVQHYSHWETLLPEFQPINVTPAALLWRRTTFFALEGFDGRFEGAEDIHLVFRAAQSGVLLGRAGSPKQCYFTRPERHTFIPYRIEGHRRLFEWIAGQRVHPTSDEVGLFLGRELLAELWIRLGGVWSGRRHVGRFLWTRLRRALGF